MSLFPTPPPLPVSVAASLGFLSQHSHTLRGQHANIFPPCQRALPSATHHPPPTPTYRTTDSQTLKYGKHHRLARANHCGRREDDERRLRRIFLPRSDRQHGSAARAVPLLVRERHHRRGVGRAHLPVGSRGGHQQSYAPHDRRRDD